MTFKAKIGDRVRLVRVPYDNIKIGHIDTVTRVHDSGKTFDVESNLNKGKGFINHVNYWELVPDPKEEAIKLLTEAGYIVTPPPPKLSGRYYIYKSDGWKSTIAKEESPQERIRLELPELKLLAVVNWTEGDGL